MKISDAWWPHAWPSNCNETSLQQLYNYNVLQQQQFIAHSLVACTVVCIVITTKLRHPFCMQQSEPAPLPVRPAGKQHLCAWLDLVQIEQGLALERYSAKLDHATKTAFVSYLAFSSHMELQNCASAGNVMTGWAISKGTKPNAFKCSNNMQVF